MKSYYEQRKKEMFELRQEKLWSLQKIADKYKISRERVRQILGSYSSNIICSKLKSKIKEYGIPSNLTNKQLAELFECKEATIASLRNGERHALENGNIKIGAEWEVWASNKLKENGIENILMPHRAHYDILTYNNIRIDVKVAVKPMSSPSLQNVSPTWRFHIKNDKKPNTADIYFLIVSKTRDVFIVPNSIIPNTNIVRFCYPSLRPSMFKWDKYHNAYQIIKDYQMLAS